MGKRVPYVLVLGLPVLGLACTDSPESTPTDPQLVVSSTCDFRAIKSGVKDYFLTTQEKLVLDLVSAMETACNAGSSQAGVQTDKGYDVIRYIERALNGEFSIEPRTGTPRTAATLLSNLFAKMPNAAVDPTTNFLPATSNGGLLGVRGGATDPNDEPVVSRGFSPQWGIEPPSDESGYTSNFDAMTSVRFALYGSGPAPFTTLQSLGTSYSLHASQAVTFNPEAIVGTCFPTDDGGPNRVQHKTAPNANAANSPVLALQFPLFCDAATAMRGEPEPTTFAGRLLRFGGQFFGPAPLYAALATKSGGGGGISTLSDFEYVTAGSLQQSFVTPPSDALALQTITVVVKVVALGTGGTQVPVEGVLVTLAVVGNNGSYNLAPPSPQGTTDETGMTTITFTLDKPGGYTVTSNATVGGYPIQSITSDMIHITQ